MSFLTNTQACAKSDMARSFLAADIEVPKELLATTMSDLIAALAVYQHAGTDGFVKPSRVSQQITQENEMNKHPKMVVGGIVDGDFSILLDPRTSIGLENRRLVEIEGFDDVAVALRNDATDEPFVIERVIPTEEYERIDSYKLIYGGAPVIKKFGNFQAI